MICPCVGIYYGTINKNEVDLYLFIHLWFIKWLKVNIRAIYTVGIHLWKNINIANLFFYKFISIYIYLIRKV